MNIPNESKVVSVGRLEWERAVRNALTPPEWDVVRLAAQGLLNPDIAQVLFKSVNTIKTQFKNAVRELTPLAVGSDVITLSRAGLAALCVEVGYNIATPCPKSWAAEFGQGLISIDRAYAAHAVQLRLDDADEEACFGSSQGLRSLYLKVKPFFVRAGMGEPSEAKLADLIVRSGVIVGPSAFELWKKLAAQAIESSREAELLYWLSKGLTNPQIGERMGISGVTIRSHLRRITPRLEPYGAYVGVRYPQNRAGLAVITLLAGIGRVPE